jgi:hypothetical protein
VGLFPLNFNSLSENIFNICDQNLLFILEGEEVMAQFCVIASAENKVLIFECKWDEVSMKYIT